MPAGTVQVGANFILSCSVTFAGTYDTVNDINTFNRNSNRSIDQFPVFAKSVAYGIPGPREVTYTSGGFLSIGDTGQDKLRSAEQNNTTVFIKALFDGTNGFNQECRVGSTTYDAAPDGLQETSFEFSGVAAATVVGTGPIL